MRLFTAKSKLPAFAEFDESAPEGTVTVVAEVFPPHTLVVEGKQLSLPQFQELLRERTRGHHDDDEWKTSKLEVILRADGDCRWQDVQYILQACPAPDIRIWRTRFAARSPDGSLEGTVKVFLPSGREEAPAFRVLIRDERRDLGSRVYFNTDLIGTLETPGIWETLLECVRESGPREGEASCGNKADPNVPLRHVLSAVDAFRQAGVKTFRFAGTPLGTGSPGVGK